MQEEATTVTSRDADGTAGGRADPDRATDCDADGDFRRRPGATGLAYNRRHIDFD